MFNPTEALMCVPSKAANPSSRTSPKDKALLPLKEHLVEQSEPLDKIRGLVPLAGSSLTDSAFVYLPVVAAHLFLEVIYFVRYRVRVTAYATGIHTMGFR